MIKNEKFNKLTFTGNIKIEKQNNGRNLKKSEFICDCGNIKFCITNDVKNGKTKSCGCLKKESNLLNKTKHGAAIGNTTTTEYGIWCGMKNRCYNPKHKKYKNYGERGIKMCDRWIDEKKGFLNFLKDLGTRPSIIYSIDRIDNNKDYTPENCRWATQKQQQRNRRDTVKVIYKGQERVLAELADFFDINLKTVKSRLNSGLDVETALTVRPYDFI